MHNFEIIVINSRNSDRLLDKYFGLRRRVFVDEQKVDLSIEIDEYENLEDTVHLIALDETGAAAGAGRLINYACHGGSLPEIKTAKLGRVCVAPEFRGKGLGRLIVEKMIEEARRRGYKKLVLHSQAYIAGLYEKFGFVRRGEFFKEAGIDHIEMTAEMAE